MMLSTLLVAVAGLGNPLYLGPIAGNMEWEEEPIVQKIPTYHPMLQFKAESKFIFMTPDLIAEGKFSVTDNHYDFHPLMANELENADVFRLLPEMEPTVADKMHKAYARSLSNFTADYNPATGIMYLTYPVEGNMKTFMLHSYTEGDERLGNVALEPEKGYSGLWYKPDPFPERLDARTRYKIGDVEGLQRFAKEAAASEAAQFGLLDLKVDKTFRNHDKTGMWHHEGTNIVLIEGADKTVFQISQDGRNLTVRGHTVYTRG